MKYAQTLSLSFATVLAFAMLASLQQSIAQSEQPRKGRFLGLPPLSCPDENPTTPEKIALGKRLFFDRELSSDHTRACASCHLPMVGFSDSDVVSLGVNGRTGDRHSLSVFNAAFEPNLMWDGRAKSLEHQALMPMANKKELNMSHQQLVNNLRKEGLEPEFKRVFGDKQITPQRVASALACFQRTLVAGDSPFDHYYFLKEDAALSESQKRGFQVFDRAGCAACHTVNENPNWTLFTDHKFHNIGVGMKAKQPDPGRFNLTHNANDWGAFRTPSLRNVAERAPYFHDGSAPTLKQAVDFHLRGGIGNKNLDPLIHPTKLTAQEETDLLAFLHSLSSPHIQPMAKELLRH